MTEGEGYLSVVTLHIFQSGPKEELQQKKQRDWPGFGPSSSHWLRLSRPETIAGLLGVCFPIAWLPHSVSGAPSRTNTAQEPSMVDHPPRAWQTAGTPEHYVLESICNKLNAH